MNEPRQYSFIRYLEAKQSVDDRSLNRLVLEALKKALSARSQAEPVRVLELGAGIGTMVERMLTWGILSNAEYTALDSQPDLLDHAQQRLANWSQGAGFRTEISVGRELLILNEECKLILHSVKCDLFDYLSQQSSNGPYDLLVANAFLDLVDLERTLPDILKLLRVGGLFYFTINFDGMTHFEPAIDPHHDKKIIDLYHQTMDERLIAGQKSGNSHTGRHLFMHLEKNNAEILAVGPSDWIVYPDVSGYPGDEAYFLHHIIYTIQTALAAYPELDQREFASWISQRHAQIEQKELIYITHQLDFVGKRRNK